MDLNEVDEAIRSLRRLGDDTQHVEAKRARDGLPKDLPKSISALSNSGGGLIILGLDESSGFRATGVPQPAQTIDKLGSWCQQKVYPTVAPSIQSVTYDGVEIVVVAIDESEEPITLTDDGSAYQRVGDANVKMTPYQLQLRREKFGSPRHDLQIVTGTSLADLRNDLLSEFVERVRSRNPGRDESIQELLIRNSVLDTSGSVTLAGLLAFGHSPQQFYPQLNATFVHYPSDDGSPVDGVRFLDNRRFDGCVAQILGDAEQAIRTNLSRSVINAGITNFDQWEYPIAALREGLANALIHRDLSQPSLGQQVQIELYPNRLEMKSPGGLHGPVSIETLFEGVTSSRNQFLMRILEDVQMPGTGGQICENRGSGIGEMLRAMRGAGMAPPSFEDRVGQFFVTFPANALMSPEIAAWIGELNEELSESQIRGLAMLKRGFVLDNPTYRSATGADSRVATAELQDLVTRELAVQTGTHRWATYTLSELGTAVDTDAGERVAARDRRAQIMRTLGDGEMSRAELQRAIGLKQRSMLHWLKKLTDEGLVEATTATKKNSNTRYRAVQRLQTQLPFPPE